MGVYARARLDTEEEGGRNVRAYFRGYFNGISFNTMVLEFCSGQGPRRSMYMVGYAELEIAGCLFDKFVTGSGFFIKLASRWSNSKSAQSFSTRSLT